MKRVGCLMDKICDPDNLRLAFHKARKGKQGKISVLKYSERIDQNLFDLRLQLLNGTFTPGTYNYFRIYDPKERLICAAAFEERIVHHAIMNICKPYFERNLIYDTYATREGKGVYSAIERARYGMRHYKYVAKLDVRKYFDSISHNVLKAKLRKIYKDNALLKLFDSIIDSYNTENGRGIPIGNLTSQYFANYYLSSLDHFIKERLRVPVYVRYMDDMLLFAEDRTQLKEYVRIVNEYIENELLLSLKPHVFSTSDNGISFLGYKLTSNVMLLNRRSKVRFKRKYRYYTNLLENQTIGELEYQNHMLPLIAFVNKAYTRKLRLATVNKEDSVLNF